MAERLAQQPPLDLRVLGLAELAPDLSAGRLGLEQLRQLLEREPQQVAEPDDLARSARRPPACRAVLARSRSARARQQADLLVVADRARRRAGQLGDLADPQRARWRYSSPGLRSPRGRPRRLDRGRAELLHRLRACGRATATTRRGSRRAARHHSAVCMLEMNGASCSSRDAVASPEKILNRTCLWDRRGDDRQHESDRDHRAGVLDEHPRAGGDPAAVGRNDAHHRRRVGRVEHARADPDDEHVQALPSSCVSRPSVVISASPAAVTSIPSDASPRDPRRSA